MRVLVTGGAGFIGSHVVEALVANGDQVLAVDDLSSGDFGWISDDLLVRADICSVEAADAVRGFRPGVMVLLAAQMSVKVSMRDPVLDARVNILGLLNMVQAGLAAGCRRFVFASSGGTVYGDVPVEDQPIPETRPKNPVSFYGLTKATSTVYLDLFSREYGVEQVSLALGNVYGPRQSPDGEAGVIAIFAGRLLKGQECVVNGDGLTTRDYVHVHDVARAFVLATRRGRGLINIGSGVPSSVLDVHRELVDAIGGEPSPPRFGPLLPGEVRAVALDATRAASELGWQACIGLEEGARTVTNFLREQVAASGEAPGGM